MTDDGAEKAPPSPLEFGEYYFAHCCGVPYARDEHWRRHFGLIADQVVERIQPARVLDAGCAFGLLVEALRERGVEAFGVDISEYAIANVPEAVRPYCRLGSIADDLGAPYDLIISIEVLEHMPADAADAAVANFCRHSDDVLFSSSPTDYREPTHVNVRPTEAWAELFARHGFFRDVDFDASFITSWAVRFRRRREPLPRLIRDYERRFAPLSMEAGERRRFAAETEHKLQEAIERERRFTVETEHKLQEALKRATAAEQRRSVADEELRHVRTALEHTHAEATRKTVELDDVRAREQATRAEADRRAHELHHARETIRLMEQSIFWRARKWLGRR